MKTAACVAAALAVTGCVIGAPQTTYYTPNPFLFLSYAASHGGIPVMVVGDPYPGHMPQVETTIVKALERSFPSYGPVFRTVSPQPGQGTKVVFIFADSSGTTADTVCRNPSAAAAGGAAGPTMTVRAVHCGVGPYSEYTMSFPAPPAPDAAFEQMMARLIFQALPRDLEPTQRFDPGSGR